MSCHVMLSGIWMFHIHFKTVFVLRYDMVKFPSISNTRSFSCGCCDIVGLVSFTYYFTSKESENFLHRYMGNCHGNPKPNLTPTPIIAPSPLLLPPCFNLRQRPSVCVNRSGDSGGRNRHAGGSCSHWVIK